MHAVHACTPTAKLNQRDRYTKLSYLGSEENYLVFRCNEETHFSVVHPSIRRTNVVTRSFPPRQLIDVEKTT